MRASVCRGKSIFGLDELLEPERGPGEVLLAFHRVGLCGTDVHIYRGFMSERVLPPRVIGHEAAAEVLEAPEGSGLSPGDRVVLEPCLACGACDPCRRGKPNACARMRFVGVDIDGALRERAAVPASSLHRLPDGVSWELGALIEPLAIAVHDVERARLASGEKVFVLGAGPIGTLIALLARETGAEVLLSEINPFRAEFVREFGFEVLDAMQGDVESRVAAWTKGVGADLVVEATGEPGGALLLPRLARTCGRLLVVGINFEGSGIELFDIYRRELDVLGCRISTSADFRRALELAAAGRLPLEQLVTAVWGLADVARALELLRTRGPQMKILIDPGR